MSWNVGRSDFSGLGSCVFSPPEALRCFVPWQWWLFFSFLFQEKLEPDVDGSPRRCADVPQRPKVCSHRGLGTTWAWRIFESWNISSSCYFILKLDHIWNIVFLTHLHLFASFPSTSLKEETLLIQSATFIKQTYDHFRSSRSHL